MYYSIYGFSSLEHKTRQNTEFDWRLPQKTIASGEKLIRSSGFWAVNSSKNPILANP
jgi:hypothetical protein